MPYKRTATFQYAANTNAELTSVTDAQGMSSSFGYNVQNGTLNSISTPYGTTAFIYFETNEDSAAKSLEGLTRAIQVSNPDGTGEMYAFFASATNGAPYNYPADQLPNGNVDNGDPNYSQSAMYLRNSYYWGKAQYEQLSIQYPAALNGLNARDFLLGRMTHWKLSSGGESLSGAISMVQEPSPDGITQGQQTW
jgi:hypothetical protein